MPPNGHINVDVFLDLQNPRNGENRASIAFTVCMFSFLQSIELGLICLFTQCFSRIRAKS